MPIKFDVKSVTVDKNKIYSIEIYTGTNDNHIGYMDSIHPMTMDELQKLKDFLTELIWKEFNN